MENSTTTATPNPTAQPLVAGKIHPAMMVRVLSTAALVPSETVKGQVYTVRHADAIDAECDCLDFQFRGDLRPCKHTRAVRAALAVIRANFPTTLAD